MSFPVIYILCLLLNSYRLTEVLKKFYLFFLVVLTMGLISSAQAQTLIEQPLGQTLQINTHFTAVYGKPTWLLIIRNMTTGKILPYLYDIRNEDNYWIALTEGQVYRVTVSTLTWGPFAKIHNFCHLENGILIKKSMFITLTGKLSPDTKRFQCHIIPYAN